MICDKTEDSVPYKNNVSYTYGSYWVEAPVTSAYHIDCGATNRTLAFLGVDWNT